MLAEVSALYMFEICRGPMNVAKNWTKNRGREARQGGGNPGEKRAIKVYGKRVPQGGRKQKKY